MVLCIGPAYTDIAIFNPFNTLYFCGGENTDGAYRFILDKGRQVIRAEKRISGEWIIADIEHQIRTWLVDDDLGVLVLDDNGLLVLLGED